MTNTTYPDFTIKGSDLFFEGEPQFPYVLAALLSEDVVSFNEDMQLFFMDDDEPKEREYEEHELLTVHELAPLLEAFLNNRIWGPQFWFAVNRKRKPDEITIQCMRQEGLWTAEHDALFES